MMSHHPRRILPPVETRKRKEREALYSAKPSTPTPPTGGEPVHSNQLLAGYMAHEFLTNGTLFGKKFEAGQAEAAPVASFSPSVELKRTEAGAQGTSAEEQSLRKEHQGYAEVASLVKTDGAHIQGIVNPTQLSQWIGM